jgi:signal transduction histidine kinase
MQAPRLPPPGLERFWPHASLRRYLVAMIVLATLPLAALVCWHILSGVRGEQAQIEANLSRSAAALAQAVENELVASYEALDVLAHAGLQQGSPQALVALLRERGAPRRGWHSIFVVDAHGQLLFDSGDPEAGGVAGGELAQLHDRVMRQRRPAVSGLVVTRDTESQAAMVAVPVPREGDLLFVLGARVAGDTWQRLAASASRPDEGYALLHDARFRLVGWTLRQDLPIGMALGPQAADTVGSRPFGVARLSGIDGRTVYAAWQQVAGSDWGVQVAVPARPVDRAHRQAIVVALAASAAGLLLGVLLAGVVARRVADPLRALALEGPQGAPDRIPVREVAMLRDALRLAARQDEEVREALEDDIAKRRQVEAQLLTAHEQLQASQRLVDLAQETGHVGFLHYRFADDVLTWTPGHCRLFGLEALDPPRLAGWFQRIEAGKREEVERDFWTACALQRPMQTLDYGVTGADGAMRWLSSRLLIRYATDGRPTHMAGVSIDMTEARAAQLRQAELTDEAVAARQAAERANRAKDEFLSILGHELRNPLGAIGAAIDVLDAAEPGSASASEARTIIARQTRNLAHKMEDLLDVGRVVSGKLQLAREPVDLAAVADRVHRTLQVTGQAAEHVLDVQLEQAWVEGDAVRLEQVVTHLVGNALQYTPAGRRIGVAVARRGGRAVLEVADAGPGIPAALLPHVFDLFVQGERPPDRRAGGLGTGLTLVRRLVELHGGTVAAESSERGSRFTVDLPAIDAPDRPAQDDDALPPSRRRRVLVVEDNPDVLAALRAKLELDGHSVSTAADGREGLTHLLRQQPEVSIVDVGLPGLTGYEVARHARAAGYAGRLIALSGCGQERDRHDARMAGFDGYLVKPVDRAELRASLGAD